MANKKAGRPTNFAMVPIAAVPRERESKHRDLMQRIFADLSTLPAGAALKLRISELGSELANVRSALNRASRAAGVKVLTSSDPKHLYVWPGPQRRRSGRRPQ